MATANLNTLLNCISSPQIGPDSRFDFELGFRSWAIFDEGDLDEVALGRFVTLMANDLNKISISYMGQSTASNFKYHLVSFFINMIGQSTTLTEATFSHNRPTSE